MTNTKENTDLREQIALLIRDITKAHPMTKSEARARVEKLVHQARIDELIKVNEKDMYSVADYIYERFKELESKEEAND